MIEHLDQCARALTAAGIPCPGYQMWVEGEAVHYWFDLQGPLPPREEARAQAILQRFFGRGGGADD